MSIVVCKSEVNILCDKSSEQAKAASNDIIALQDFYRRSEVGWRDEFEKWFKQTHTSFDCKDLLLSFDEWFNLYTRFASQVPKVLWTPFENNLTEFNFIVCEFVHDGFYDYFEFGQQKVERDWKFIRTYRNRQDARDFTEAHNKKLRMLKKEQAEKNLVKNLVPKSNNLQTEPLSKVENSKTFDWKEAMKALIDGKRVEARVCIPGLPESENGWFDLEFAIGPDDREFGESVKFGKDWDYRIKDDSKERKKLFDECEKLGIINVSKASKISTPLLHDIVDAIKSIDLDWEGIAKQVNGETK